MGLLRDREEELPELQRLLLRVKDPARRAAISPEQWPTAMVAYALDMSEDPAMLTEGLEVYAEFARQSPPTDRASALAQLGRFVTARRGEGWRALLLFVLGERQQTQLCTRAATMTLTLAPPGDESRFPGAAVLAHLVEQGLGAPGILSALLSVSDLRLLPLLSPLCSLPADTLAPLIRGLSTTVNSLSAEWLLRAQEAQPTLESLVTDAFIRLAAKTPLVADLVYPIPTWAFTNPTPQPLHAWTLSEFLPRMRSRLTPAQLLALTPAFTPAQ